MKLCSALVRAATVLALAHFPSPPAIASDVVVKVMGIKSDDGEIGCALFSSAKGFPMDRSEAGSEWHPAKREGVTCRFDGVKPGNYAIAVSHDLNGNRRTDTKLFGIPKEDWGVSNEVRPRMRAPKFEEAMFPVADGQTISIQVKVGR